MRRFKSEVLENLKFFLNTLEPKRSAKGDTDGVNFRQKWAEFWAKLFFDDAALDCIVLGDVGNTLGTYHAHTVPFRSVRGRTWVVFSVVLVP